MTSRDGGRRVWDSLATQHGSTAPLKAVIGSTSLGNEYFDRSTKRSLSRLDLGPDDVVLDFGCGVGRLSLWLAPRVRSVLGADISHEMVKVASQRAGSSDIRNVSFTVLENGALPLEDGTVSFVVCSGVLKYFMTDDDCSRVVRELSRVLKGGGRVAVIDECADNGPLRVAGTCELGGECVLRSPSQYETVFAEHSMRLRESRPVYRKRAVARLERLERALKMPDRAPKWARALAITLDLELEDLFRRRGRSPRGFRLLVFEKVR